MKRTLIYTFIILSVLFVAGSFYANHTLKLKVEAFLAQQLSPQLQFQYDAIYMDIWTGDLSFDNITVQLSNAQGTMVHTAARVNSLELIGLSYWNYLVDDVIEVDEVLLNRNDIVYYQDQYKPAVNEDSVARNPLARLSKAILIEHFEIDQMNLSIYDNTKDSTVFYAANASLTVKNMRTDGVQIAQQIPLTYEALDIQTDSIKVKISPYEDMFVGHTSVTNDCINIDTLTIVPRYSKRKFERLLKTERDYMNLLVPRIEILNYNYGFNKKRF